MATSLLFVILVSFDEESLFTNVPIQDRTVDHFTLEVIALFKLCLTSTYFVWNGQFYEKDGGAMGRLIVANLFMENFEKEALRSAPMKPKYCLKYVDDIFIVWQYGTNYLREF